MFIISKIREALSYKIIGNNNTVVIVENGIKKPLKRKIKGLDIDIVGSDNYVELNLPITFEDTTIKIRGSNSSFKMMPTDTIMRNTFFDLESWAEVYIGCNSRFNVGGTWVCVNNNVNGCPHKLVIGDEAQIGRNILIRTSDGHAIFNEGEELPYNEPQDVIIGNRVWIGERAIILKGTELADDTIVGAGAVVNKKFTESKVIVAGNPAKIIKKNVTWQRKPYGSYINNKYGFSNGREVEIKEVIIKKLKYKFKKLLSKVRI